MAATLTTASSLLRRIYTPDAISEQLYNETPFLSRVQKTNKFAIGELGRSVIHVGRNGGYTAVPAGAAALNAAGNQQFNKAEYNHTNHHQGISLSGDVIDETDGNSLALASALDTEISGALTDLRRNLQRQLFLNGDALIGRCISSTTNEVEGNYSVGEAINRGWIYPGMKVQIGTTADETAIGGAVPGRTVTTVQATSANAFAVDGAAITGEGTTHYVGNTASRVATTSYEMNGLRNLCSTTAVFGGLDPATVSIWSAAGNTTTSQPLTISLMLQADQAIHQKTGKKANFVLTGLKQARKFYELLQQQVRFGSDGAPTAGAQSNPTWNGMDVFVDPDCWDGDMYFGQLENLFILQNKKPYWKASGDNVGAVAWVQGYDSWVNSLTYRMQLGTTRRNGFYRYGYTVDLSATASGLS